MPSTIPRHPFFWPLGLRRAASGIASILMHAFMLARERALASSSPTVRSLAERDDDIRESGLLKREVGYFHRRFLVISPLKRPHVPPADRFEILQIMRLRGLSVEEAADRFVLHPNTIRDWIQRFETHLEAGTFFGRAAFNKISDAVRWVVHEIRRLSPEPDFGTRSIAMAIVRAGIGLSRSSVQRMLREKPPPPPEVSAADKPSCTVPHGILRPKARNRTWHLDFTTLEFFWLRFYVAALVDGFSRKLLALRVYRKPPSTRNMLALVRRSVRRFGVSRFLITDQGTQFRRRFTEAIQKWGVTHVKGRKAPCQFNGKVERFSKTLKLWQRLTLFAWKTEWIQRRLDVFRNWYNTERPMVVLGGRTPEEAWNGRMLAEPIPVRASDPFDTFLQVTRHRYRGDPRLPTIEIKTTHRLKRSA